jgi:putative flippase GtrA
MNSGTTAMAGSTGGSTAAVVVLTWLLGLLHITIPPEVSAAAVALLAPLVHYVANRIPAHLAPPSLP